MLFKSLKKYCHFNFISRLSLYILILFAVACESAVDSAVADVVDNLENTLNDSNLGGNSGSIDDYFYNLDSDQINAKYYKYDNNAMENPQFYFDQASDTLNFSTFPCYLTSIDNNLDEALTSRNLESTNVYHVEGEVDIDTETYFNIQKFEWSEEEARYQAYPQAGPSQEVTYTFDEDLGEDHCSDMLEDGDGGCLVESDPPVYNEDSNPDPNSDNYNEDTNPEGTQGDGLYDGNGAYDEGEEYVDSNGNGAYDEGEVYFDTIGGNQYVDIYNTKEYRVNYDLQSLGEVDGIYYIDQEEWVTTDSVYSSSNYVFEHTFSLQKDVVSADSLMWVVSTDCNENNMRDADSERYVAVSEDCNGVDEVFIADPENFYDNGEDGCVDVYESGDGECQDTPNYGVEHERYIDINDSNDYDEGETFTDTNGNGIWDAAETFVDLGNGQYDVGEDYTDLGNGLYDEGETFTDTNGNGIWDNGEEFIDTIGDCAYTSAEDFVDTNGNGAYDIGEEYTDTNGNGVWDDAEEFVDTIGNGTYDIGEEYADTNGNGAWDDSENFNDTNGNGAFDYPESVLDTGDDNCFDEFEDGQGGCTAQGASGDPNGDNYDSVSNPSGTEGNGGAPDQLVFPCADRFEDGQGGCFSSTDPDYFSGDPNGDNDINNDNYDENDNVVGTEGNNQFDEGEPWDDISAGTEAYDIGFCDRTNNMFDPSEVHLDLEEEGEENGQWEDTEPFQDRNCNQIFDLGELTSSSIDQTYCENSLGGIWLVGVEVGFDFCDVGNGVYDASEYCRDGSENCDSGQLYEMSDRPNSLVVSYEGDSPEAFLTVLPGDNIENRWGVVYENLIETANFTDTQFESVVLIDSIITVHSNPIIEQLESDSPTDYYIAKSVWYDDSDRDYDYHIFREGDDGNIYKLTHRSYFLPAGFYSAYDEGGFWFEENARDELFLYAVNGELRDNERFQYSRIDSTDVAEYLVQESYAVDYEEVTVPMRKFLGEVNDEGNVLCAANSGAICPDCAQVSDCSADTTFSDCFKVSREKTTTMYGTGIEYVENSETYFVKHYGIVKDDVEFRWNTAPGYENDLEGQYRWEMIVDRDVDSDCPEENFLQSLVNSKEPISINQFDNISDFNYDPYNKARTYGLQRILKERNSQ